MEGGEIAGILGLPMQFASMGLNAKAQNDMMNIYRDQLAWAKEVQRKTWEREDTATQRRTADMKLAGINPLMAGIGGGAPTGGIAPMPAIPNASGFGANQASMMDTMINTVIRGLELGNTSKKTDAEIKQIDHTINNIDADTANKIKELKSKDIQQAIMKKQYQVTVATADLIRAQTAETVDRAYKIGFDIKEAKKRMEKMDNENERLKVQKQIDELQRDALDRVKSLEDFIDSKTGVKGSAPHVLKALGGLLDKGGDVLVNLSSLAGTGGTLIKWLTKAFGGGK